MILFWMKAFKKPTEEQNRELLDMYLLLNEENQKKVNRKNKLTIGGYFSLAIFCLLASTVILGLELFTGIYSPYGLVFDLVFFGLSIYATYTSSTWLGAKPYQRLLLCLDLVVRFIDQQRVVEVDTSQSIIDHMDDNDADKNSENKPSAKNTSTETETEQPAEEKSGTTPANDKKE